MLALVVELEAAMLELAGNFVIALFEFPAFKVSFQLKTHCLRRLPLKIPHLQLFPLPAQMDSLFRGFHHSSKLSR